MIKQVDEKLSPAVCALKFLRFNLEITGTEVYVSWNQPFPFFFFFLMSVLAETVFVQIKIKSNEVV